MPLVPALCTQCGSKLEIDSAQEAAICPFCKTPFVTEKAINNYNTTNVTNIGNLHADVVTISDDQSRDNRVKSGETFVRMDDYTSAQRIFGELTAECPYDYRGWWGLIQVYSKNFTDMNISRSELLNIETIYDKACTVANADDMNAMNAKYNKYHDTVKNKLDVAMDATNQEINQLSSAFNREKSDLENRITAIDEQIKNSKEPSEIVALVVMVGTLIMSILVGIVEGIGDFFAALILFGLIAGGIYFVSTFILDIPHEAKMSELKTERASLQQQLDTLERKHNENVTLLYETLKKVGVN